MKQTLIVHHVAGEGSYVEMRCDTNEEINQTLFAVLQFLASVLTDHGVKTFFQDLQKIRESGEAPKPVDFNDMH